MGSNRHPGEPGHVEGDEYLAALIEKRTAEEGADEDLADVDLGYRQRGRPRLDPSLRRREKLILSLTVEELRRIMLKAASDSPTPLSPNDWARRELLRLASEEKP